MNPPQEACMGIDDKMFCFAMLADKNEGTVYSNLTGKFPVQIFEGQLYVFVCFQKNIYVFERIHYAFVCSTLHWSHDYVIC